MFKVVKIIFVFPFALGLADAALQIDNESEFRESQAALFNADSTSGWVLLDYVDANTIHFAAGGEGGASDVLSHLVDDQIQYILLRVGGIQERGTLKTTYRDVFITWIGPNVDSSEKAQKTAHVSDAEALLQPFHASLTVLNKDNFSDENVIDRSHPLSGSHVID